MPGSDEEKRISSASPARVPSIKTERSVDAALQLASHTKSKTISRSQSGSTTGSANRSATSRNPWRRLQAWKPPKEIVYNAILGTSDGMTVPFAVTASLAGVADAKLVMLAGLSELIAGAVSMAAGGVLGARADVQKYSMIERHLQERLTLDPSLTSSLLNDTFSSSLPAPLVDSITSHIELLPVEDRLAFLLRFTNLYHDPAPPSTSGTWKIALVLGLGYFSGLVPLIPYMAVERTRVDEALYVSIGVTAVLLALFGYFKTAMSLAGEAGRLESRSRRTWLCVRGAIECLAVVGLSAGLSVVVIRGIGGTL